MALVQKTSRQFDDGHITILVTELVCANLIFHKQRHSMIDSERSPLLPYHAGEKVHVDDEEATVEIQIGVTAKFAEAVL